VTVDEVLAARTLTTLLLGGDPAGAPGVRGLVIGRTHMYPLDGHVGAAVDISAGLVHGGGTRISQEATA
jgi:hypothetical protein